MDDNQYPNDQVEEEVPNGEESNEAESAFREFVHHQRIALEELGRAIESLIPKDFRDHTRNAGKAFVDSFKSLVDAARDDMQRASENNEEANGSSATKVKVEIE